MITIAQNPFYHVLVDLGENRLFIKVVGAWNAQEEVSTYTAHLQQGLASMEPGFSILCDIREMGDISPAVQEMFVQAQRMTLKAGVDQIAEVHTLNNSGSDIAIRLARESQIPLNIFDNPEDALAWLNDQEPPR